MKTLQLYFNDSIVTVNDCYEMNRHDMVTTAIETGAHYYVEGKSEGYATGYAVGTVYGICLTVLIALTIKLLDNIFTGIIAKRKESK